MRRASKWVVGGLVVVVVVIAAIYVAGRIGLGPAGPSLTAQQARALIQTKNVGLGQLENQDLPEGLAAFSQIATQVPADPLGPRNIAVARVLALGVEYEPAPEPLIATAKEALAKMAAIEGETADYHWLALRAALAAEDFAAAHSHFNALAAANPEDPAVWYARFRAYRLTDAREIGPEAAAAIATAFELRPTNAWLLVEWLRATGSRLSAELDALPPNDPERAAGLTALQTKYARLPELLAAARPTALSFAPVIQAHTRVDVLAFLDEASQAVGKGDFRTVATRMMVLGNVLLPHAVPDRLAVGQHPLEFLLDRFQPDFYKATQVAEAVPPPAIEVRFSPPDAWQVPAELQQQAGELRDLALADFDLDGRLDVLAIGTKQLVVWSRKDEAAGWQVLASAPAEGYQRLVVQDLDADFDETRLAVYGPTGPLLAPEAPPALKNVCPSADVDVVLYGEAGVALFENFYNAQSKQRTLRAIPADRLPAEPSPVLALTSADLEADGDLDLVLATASGLRLWRNNSEWQFIDMSLGSVLPDNLAGATELVALDWDRDIDMDVLIAAPGRGGWLENLRHGQFRWQPFVREQPQLYSAQAIAPVDADGRAQWDLLTAGASGIWHLEFRGIPVVSASRPTTALSDFPATNLLTWDYDNDGWEDCLAWSASNLRTFRGKPENQFEAVDLLVAAPQQIAGAAVGDLDADGDQDLALLAAGRIVLLENQGGNRNHWIDVALQARQIKGQQIAPSGRVSPYGLGGLLELKAGERYPARIVRGQTTHFGLGQETLADVIRVGWLNGVPQNIIQPAADLFVCEQQILNTSCPYLYAWDGERFVFVTDLLWNAPLGLQLAEGQLAPWRDWEYLKIPGHQLAPKDGHYLLQATAELWEADYFDHVRLIAVDHPAEVEIYSNEKVGPPQMAEYKIHTVRRPQSPVAARSQAGRDLLGEIASQDGIYAKPFERKLLQGVTEEHDLELDLGNLGEARQVTLFLTGWVYPAATSINVGLSQGGSIAPPRPPSLKVQDSAGNWQTALPFMGFPGGKTKTIAIPLPRETLAMRASDGALRLRISTSMEFYWDHIFFTADEPAAEVRTTELKLVSADLHERGFSRVVRDESNGPEQFLYDEVSLTPKWPPMLGNFTRYGDVLELLTVRDDHLLVMGAGDETTLSFKVPAEPIPPGWKRDFLLYSVGWDKDANLQTVLGRSSEPLPFESMSGYPWPPDEKTPDSPAYREYLRKYQTRQQTSAYQHTIERFQVESGKVGNSLRELPAARVNVNPSSGDSRSESPTLPVD